MVYAVAQFTVQDDDGNIYPNAQITVFSEDSEGLATLYSDRAGTTPLSNPFNADSDGFVQFFAPGGAYRIDATNNAEFTATHRYVAVGTAGERDADDYGQLEPTLRWQTLVDISNTDIDDLLVSGFYKGSNISNAPEDDTGVFYVQVLVNKSSAADAFQIAWNEDANPQVYIRCRISTSWGSWISFPVTSAVNAWSAQQYFSVATLTDGTDIAWNLDTQQVATLELNENSTMAYPTNVKAGGVYILIVKQGGSGGFTLGFASGYNFTDGNADIDTAAGGYTVFTFIGNADATALLGVASTSFSAAA